MNIKKIIVTALFALVFTGVSWGAEGMWIPLFLKKLNETEMKSLGMKISAEDIYSVNKSSLKDAVVLFGGGCTGEVVSPNGLLFTNHHCGYSVIAAHSTIEDNILQNGFWAKNRSEEKINPSLSVTFIKRIEDVTKDALKGVTDKMPINERNKKIKENLASIKKNAKVEAWQNVEIKPFFKDNQYFMFVRETYSDVRLVGCPPVSVGKYGSETDNWVWPRHTGDFSVFRIYADKNNRPAAPSADNVPYRPDHFFPISLNGVKENDFTLVFGFPGTTNEYLPAIALEQTANHRNPVKVGMRDIALKIWGENMNANDTIKLLYSNRYVSAANAWKKWQGESLGLNKTNAVNKKKEYEKAFTATLTGKKEALKELLPKLYTQYKTLLPYGIAYDAMAEFSSLCDAYKLTNVLNNYERMDEKDSLYASVKEFLKKSALKLISAKTVNIDKKVFASLSDFYYKNIPSEFLPQQVKQNYQNNGNNWNAVAQTLYSSPLMTEKGIEDLFSKSQKDVVKALNDDIMVSFFNSINKTFYQEVLPNYKVCNDSINFLMKKYMKAQMEAFPQKAFFPDANLTLRASYGQVKGMQARDGIYYIPQTYLDGVIEKYIPGDKEYDLPAKVLELYKAKDYGRYGENGKLPVCFIATNHTTGGNSGSPAINANGELIGLNFDRLWEGTMSDLNYDPSICRNIMVDIRYVLWLMDKVGGAGYLLDEMKISESKK
ncbi:MAG: S46 family peptidase [Flavobacteriales bacterium]|nr:S46 family peptidase [Flavobacteriales bacterium]